VPDWTAGLNLSTDSVDSVRAGAAGGFSGGLVEVDEGAANESVAETGNVPGLREMGIDPEEGL
jgi:hypothetical protein